MDIPRREIEETKKFIQEHESIKHVHFRDIYKNIDLTNYQICTKVDFKEIKPTHETVMESWGRLKHSLGDEVIYEYKSKSGSCYFSTKNGDMYRLSDHWGAVATCEWTLDGTGNLMESAMESGPLQMGVVNLREFVIFRRKYSRKVDILVNPLWTAKIVEIVPLVVKLESIKLSDEFKDLPGPDKQLIGASHGQFVRILRQISK